MLDKRISYYVIIGEGMQCRWEENMKYRKWMGTAGMAAIVLLGYANVWANEASECIRFYQAEQYKQAFLVCRQAGDHGYANAQATLGFMYNNGQGVTQDDAEAVKWYRKSAIQGYAMAQNNLGFMYASGRGVMQDYAEAVKWYRKSADQGYAKAQSNLGFMYDNGRGVMQDYAEAVKWYRKSADQGLANAQYNLGVMYAKGRGVMRSGTAATDWFYKAGLSYLKEGNKHMALTSVERIKDLPKIGLTAPNLFLANKLLAQIYGGSGSAKTSPKAKQQITASQVVSGTGWPVAGGYVVTNHHVVAGRKTIILLRMDGMKIPAVVAVDDATNDLALLKPRNGKRLPPALPLANRPAQVGERVFTVGYPHPGMMGVEPKLTQGIINARTGLENDPRTYQISVPIQSGNSGGPLINMRGQVVGVTTSKLRAAKVFKWTGDLPQNVNYAVKVGYVQILLSSVDPVANVPVMPAKKGNLAGLAKRIEKSVLMVIAK